MPAPDDPISIPDTSTLLRALSERHLKRDGEGQICPNSAAFQPSSDGSGTSVVVTERMGSDSEGNARRPGAALEPFDKHELWFVAAGDARSAAEPEGRLGVVPDPLPNEPGHANITWPEELGRGAAHRARRRLADMARPVAATDL